MEISYLKSSEKPRVLPAQLPLSSCVVLETFQGTQCSDSTNDKGG